MIYTKNNALKVSGFMDSGNDSTYKNKPIIYLSNLSYNKYIYMSISLIIKNNLI